MMGISDFGWFDFAHHEFRIADLKSGKISSPKGASRHANRMFASVSGADLKSGKTLSRRTGRLVLAAWVGFLALWCGMLTAQTESVSMTGSLYLYNASGNAPIPLAGYEVYLYHSESKKWIGPSISDAYGRYAFQGLQEGRYVMRVYMAGRDWRQQVWQQEVSAPGEIPPIVLGAVYRVVPNAEYAKIGDKRYHFSLWLDIPRELQEKVQKVTYFFNHPSFTRKENEVSDPSAGFRYTYTGWGCLQRVYITLWMEGKSIEIEFFMCDALKEDPGK